MRCLGLFFGLVLLAAHAPAQVDDAAGKLLQQAGERYRTLRSFYFEAAEVSTTRSGDIERTNNNHIVAAMDGEGRSRIEVDDGVSSGVRVSNGKTVWVYSPRLKQYSVFPASLPEEETDEAASEPNPSRGPDLTKVVERYLGRYRGVGDGLIEAKLVREETVEMRWSSLQCQVVEAHYQPGPGVPDGRISRTYWIDPQSNLIVRERSVASMKPANMAARVEVLQQIDFREANADLEAASDLFVFQPPEGARQVELAGNEPASASSFTGKPAPDFTLQDLAGERINLAELRGQVVLLDFWATWCGPCRIDMPRIEALYNELKGRGLRVFGVNGERAEVASAYVKGNGYTFPTLSDPGMRVARLFQVNVIPTAIVIDTEGNVRAYLQGSGPKDRLLQAIREAGLAEAAEH
jgi:peroxiredoxin/outer membrane lipoprotein-sorting protein